MDGLNEADECGKASRLGTQVGTVSDPDHRAQRFAYSVGAQTNALAVG